MKKIILFFIFISNSTFASFDMNENMKRSYSHIINLEFEKANVLLYKEKSHNPQNGFIALYNNYIDFLTILISEDVDYFESHKDLKNKRLDLLDEMIKILHTTSIQKRRLTYNGLFQD